MEDVAAKWVSKCAFWYPNPQWFPDIKGRNMILQKTGTSKNHFKTARFYAKQAKYFNYENNTCTGNCRYYKLIAWAASTEVGCAYNACLTKKKKKTNILSCVFNNM
uniref:SCP domain-containing protein n=1 Tax=Mesocestoides corti TaxID=53468 RepID=A0A5K3FKN0_MESCO